MTHPSPRDLAGHLARALMADSSLSGVELGICEQVLADALATEPPPRTLLELAVALGRARLQGPLAVELLDALRRRVRLAPDAPLDELAA